MLKKMNCNDVLIIFFFFLSHDFVIFVHLQHDCECELFLLNVKKYFLTIKYDESYYSNKSLLLCLLINEKQVFELSTSKRNNIISQIHKIS